MAGHRERERVCVCVDTGSKPGEPEAVLRRICAGPGNDACVTAVLRGVCQARTTCGLIGQGRWPPEWHLGFAADISDNSAAPWAVSPAAPVICPLSPGSTFVARASVVIRQPLVCLLTGAQAPSGRRGEVWYLLLWPWCLMWNLDRGPTSGKRALHLMELPERFFLFF